MYGMMLHPLKSRLIDSIQHRVLARAMGVRRSTSSEALEVETGVEPLSLRRCFLTARVYLRYLTAKTRTGRLIRAHRDGNLTVFRSRFYSSFSLRGENLVCADGDFPKDSNFLGRMVISWESKWRSSARGRWFFYLHPKVSMVPGKWASGFPRWVVSTLAGMRLGNTILKDDLHRCRLESSPLCRCGEPETRGHFWLRCSRYTEARATLQADFDRILGRPCRLSVPLLISFDFSGRKLCETKVAYLGFGLVLGSSVCRNI